MPGVLWGPCFVAQKLRNGGTIHVVSGTSDFGCASHHQAASNSVVKTEEETYYSY